METAAGDNKRLQVCFQITIELLPLQVAILYCGLLLTVFLADPDRFFCREAK